LPIVQKLASWHPRILTIFCAESLTSSSSSSSVISISVHLHLFTAIYGSHVLGDGITTRLSALIYATYPSALPVSMAVETEPMRIPCFSKGPIRVLITHLNWDFEISEWPWKSMQTPEYFATRNGAQKQFHALRDNEVPFPMPMMP